jgi:hypothetical protein
LTREFGPSFGLLSRLKMDDVYDSYGIVLKTWFAAKRSESKKNSYYVVVWEWNYHRRIIERDGLISFQVTVHCRDGNCYTCRERVSFVNQQLVDQNVQCFWTHEPDDDSLYVTVRPPPQRPSADVYLSFLLGLPIARYSSLRRRKQRQTKAGSRNRRHSVQ